MSSRVLQAQRRDLLSDAQRGDHTAQAALFERYKGLVARQVLRMTGEAASVDDLVQEVFIAVFQKLSGFRGEAQIETWLYRVTANKVRNWWDSNRRRRAREQRVVRSVDEPDLNGSPQHQLEADAKLQRFYAALFALDRKFREAFVARAIDELSLEVAAERLQVPISTVSYRARRAEELLTEALGLREDSHES